MLENNSLLRICDFLKNKSRNKLIITEKQLDYITFFDIGLNYAKELSLFALKNKNSYSIDFDILSKLVSENTQSNELFGRFLAIKNTGILFEDALKINFQQFITSNSQNYALILLWEYGIEGGFLKFGTNKNIIDLKNISHIII